MNSTLYLIPAPLGDGPLEAVIPSTVRERLLQIKSFVVEETRTARRYLSEAGLKGHIQELEFHELNEHTTPAEVEALLTLFRDGVDVGLISEAGLPAVADPGAQLVALCHRHGIRVVPLVGPSSLMLALMASGLNGQRFAFNGYLPVKPAERRQAIQKAEKRSLATSETEIFIETPYRNDSLLSDLLGVLSPSTRLCVATNLTCPDEQVRTLTVSNWKKAGASIGKNPTVFLFLAK